MQKTITKQPELKLIGITTRTSNAELLASNPATNKVAATVQKFFHSNLASKINNRKKPGTTYCVYTNYESDHNGEYTYFIGEEVSSFDKVDKEFETLTIPAQNYAKFTNKAGPMPTVCVDMWQNIWQMDKSALGGDRSYVADFEVYDERSVDHTNVVLDINIGII
jgi:predicted transcriptional regulator YdeE